MRHTKEEEGIPYEARKSNVLGSSLIVTNSLLLVFSNKVELIKCALQLSKLHAGGTQWEGEMQGEMYENICRLCIRGKREKGDFGGDELN